ncbi:hypothetical protein D9756_009465 [Leucocoprinus leucothites]|uniref:DUF1275 domain protein n=1 Tax=Leucocoprinus leucothites TaxID=201217 RepID=A0A8H5FUG5_9AGAR|nr:hypothetical protein D9756_009465 [Leucoagaricus leucothites]
MSDRKSNKKRSDEDLSGSDLERGQNNNLSLWQYLLKDVDPKQTTGPLAAYCFMTGYIDVISFSAIFVWCGFQTGNFAQLAIALARLFEGAPGFRDMSFHKADQQALCSLISFQLGAFFGRLGDRIGPHKRIWLILGTFVQALLTMAGAIAFWKSGQPGISGERDLPAWTNALTFVGLAFISASLGVQGIVGKRLNTQFGTTIVLTTVWVELFTDPGLFNIRKRILSRDHRLIAASALFIGAFVGRAILAKLGTAGALGVAVGFRVLMSFQWIFVPSKGSSPSS